MAILIDDCWDDYKRMRLVVLMWEKMLLREKLSLRERDDIESTILFLKEIYQNDELGLGWPKVQ